MPLFPNLSYRFEPGISTWRHDVVAGLTVSVLLVPQAMAYGLLAGLPPVYGLYASLVPLLLYALIGTSPHVAIGPTALISLLVFTGIDHLAPPGTATFITLVLLMSLLAGLLQLALGALRLGVLVSFLSRPVISGFTSASAVIIALTQVKYLFGLELPSTGGTIETLQQLFLHLPQTRLLALLLGAGALGLLVVQKRRWPRLPGALLLMVIGTGLTALLRLDLSVVGHIPRGLPHWQWPFADWALVGQAMPGAMTIALISFIEAMAISKTIETRHDYYRVDANRELIALGAAKVAGAFFQAMPTSGSFSRSALNEDSGARTGLAGLVSAAVVLLVLLFLTPAFYYLPNVVLAAVIIMAVAGLFEWNEMRRLWGHDRRDFITLMTTFLITLVLGVQQGILTGVLLSLALVIYRNARPHIAVLGRLPNSGHFRNVSRFSEAVRDEDVLIIRFDSQLYFANADYFRTAIEELIAAKGEKIRLLILDGSAMHDLDSTGAYALQQLVLNLRKRDVRFALTGVIGPVRDRLYRTGLMAFIGPENQFLDIAGALDDYRRQDHEDRGWDVPAVQTRYRGNRKSRRR